LASTYAVNAAVAAKVAAAVAIDIPQSLERLDSQL
jgi:hypothetical protein